MHPLGCGLNQGQGQPPPKTPSAIISGMGEATDFKFGQNIYRVHPNKSPLKILDQKGAWVDQGYNQLSQERVKLLSSNFVRTFTQSIGTKLKLKIKN